MTLTPEEFCARYAEVVARFAAIVAPDRSDADDIAQEALLKALSRLDRFDPSRGGMEAWLWKIVLNESRDTFRRAIRRRAAMTRWGQAAPPRRGADELARVADALVLESALKRLGARDRELLALRYGADLNVDEVAAVVGLNTESCGRALRRAIERLRAVVGTDL